MHKMSKKLIFGLFLFMLAVTVSAGVRLDLALDVPFYFGINLQGENVGDMSQFTFLFPEASLHYLLDLGVINIGLGARMFTLILESIAWPNALVEVDLDPVVLSAQLGGGAFLVFGLYNDSGTGPIMLGDLTAAYKFSDAFRLGLGAFTVIETDEESQFSDEGNFPYAIYVFGKFSFNFD